MELSKERVRFRFNRHDPIEIQELGGALNAISEQYSDILDQDFSHMENIVSDDYKLYVSHIVDNCILLEIASQVKETIDQIVPIVNNLASSIVVFEVGRKICNSIIQKAKGEFIRLGTGPALNSTEAGKDDIQEIKSLSALLNVTRAALGDSKKGNLTVELFLRVKDGDIIEERFSVNNEILSKAEYNIKKRIRELKKNISYKDAFIRMIKSGNGKNFKYLGLIKNLDSRARPINWVRPADAKAFKDIRHKDIFAYIADVQPQKTSNNKIEAYNILSVHKIIFSDRSRN